MKSVLVNGARLDMDDRVASALVDYALALADRGMSAAATVPMRFEGHATTATLNLGAPAVWVVLECGDAGALPGSDAAADELETRLTQLLQRTNVHVTATSPHSDSAFDWLDFS